MSTQCVAIVGAGMVTSVGLTAAATCAAIRAGTANPTQTRFSLGDGEWLMAHQVTLTRPWGGRDKLVKMAAMAVLECLDFVSAKRWDEVPMLLCVAEAERPGRLDGLDGQLFSELQAELGMRFREDLSSVVPSGRPAALLALAQARKLLVEDQSAFVLIVATDSLLLRSTVDGFGQDGRLLRQRNSNGFIPGEGAGALLIGSANGQVGETRCVGIGAGTEPAALMSGLPLRAVGLTQAIRSAMTEAGCEIHDLDFRVTDNSGEQFYFKETSLALGRLLRHHKEEFDHWHPADCIGEVGAVAGIASLAVAHFASLKGYAAGSRILIHGSGDTGVNAAAVLTTAR